MFSIPVAHPFGVTVQPGAVIAAARAGPSTSTRLPTNSIRCSPPGSADGSSCRGTWREWAKKILSTCQSFIWHWLRFLSQGTVMACKGWTLTSLSPPPHNAWWLPLLPSQSPAQSTSSIPSLVSSKGSVLCLPLLLRSALQIILSFLLSSPRHSTEVPVPLYSLQVQNQNIFLFFLPHEKQSTCSGFHPHPIFCPSLVFCLFLQENIHNEKRLRRSQHPSRQLLLLHKGPIKIFFSLLPSHANHPAVIRAAAWLQGKETEARGQAEFFQ